MPNRNQNCPVCDSKRIENFLKRKDLPIHQHLIFSDEQSAINTKRGNLELTLCNNCGFVFNRTFDACLMEYGQQYDNSQTFSKYFESYLSKLVNSLVIDHNIKNSNIVEVGCGKGLFLRKLVEKKEWGNIGFGFDPSYIGPEVDMEGRLTFQKIFFDNTCLIPNVDVVICRHVIEHISQPVDFLKSIKDALPNNFNIKIFCETPTVEWVLKNNVFWDFFYEHCSYFTAESLTTCFEQAGFHVKNVKHVFNGQYLWLAATLPKITPEVTTKSKNISKLAKEFALKEQDLILKWKKKVIDLKKTGKVAICGAGAKGVTFVNLIDPEKKLIDYVIDLNPQKQHKFVPGTGHLIINFTEITENHIKNAILMNPNYQQEIISLLQKMQIKINLIR
ncbi:MAG: class I SAM-dependent methyltransferase [Nitrosarchaeum sp.]